MSTEYQIETQYRVLKESVLLDPAPEQSMIDVDHWQQFRDELERRRNEIEANCRQRDGKRPVPKKFPTSESVTDPFQYVYLIRSPDGVYKIGKTANPEQRLRAFLTQFPFAVEYVSLIRTENMGKLEKELHRKFDLKRLKGEWFALSDDDVTYIKGLAS